ncbi:DUF6916 family protein [Stappia sp.]|jgi:hypothetical protein|uniref:DUF6916 family protein n=1 Tax=Stappia sp. TaxID=1870903 RepID=UPI003A993959
MADLEQLAGLTAEHFEARMDRKARISANGETMDLAIATVTRLNHGTRDGGAFSVLFDGPPTPMVDQGLHEVEIEGDAALALFLVPVYQDETGTRYEAVFT